MLLAQPFLISLLYVVFIIATIEGVLPNNPWLQGQSLRCILLEEKCHEGRYWDNWWKMNKDVNWITPNFLILMTVLWSWKRQTLFFREQTAGHFRAKSITSTTYSQTVQGQKCVEGVEGRKDKADVPNLNIWGKWLQATWESFELTLQLFSKFEMISRL